MKRIQNSQMPEIDLQDIDHLVIEYMYIINYTSKPVKLHPAGAQLYGFG